MPPVTTRGIDQPVSEAGQVIATVLTYGLALTVIVLTVRLCARRGTWWPLALLVTGGLTFLLEPLFDHLYGLWFREEGQWHLLTTYGSNIPVWVPAAYVGFYGGSAVLVWNLIERGTLRSVRDAFRVYALMVCIALAAEITYIEILGTYEYQGPQPFKVLGYPLFLAFCNLTSPLVAGIMFHHFTRHVQGVLKVLAAWCIPLYFALGAFGGGVIYLALRHAEETPADAVLWVTSLTCVASSMLFVRLAATLLPREEASRPVAKAGDAGVVQESRAPASRRPEPVASA